MARKPPPASGRWKKGQSGNPKGMPVAYREFNNASLRSIFGRCAAATMPQLKEMATQPGASAMQLLVAGTLERAVEERDATAISYLLERFLPKPKDPIDVNLQLATMTDTELIELAQARIKSLTEDPLVIEAELKNEYCLEDK